ncbi:MAG: hypothetical protein ACUVTL_05665 [Thermoproteota archaeon]
MGFFIVGSPTETEEDVIDTLKFIKTHDLDQICVFITTPYPGTLLWDYLKDKGIVMETFDWSGLTMGSRMRFDDLFLVADSIDLSRFRELYLGKIH